MNQPELGKKIAELRKVKGLTQDELVEKCNLSVRTLQRIEAGEVTPRSYTIKIIFAALDYNVYNSSDGIDDTSNIHNWLEQTYRYIIDLFNLKTNTMKKVTILTITGLAIAFGLFTLCSDSKAQNIAQVKKAIEESNKNFIRWHNSGQVDSCLSNYRDDACVSTISCGKEVIRELFKSNVANFKIKEIRIVSVSVCDSIAVEKGNWVIQFESGDRASGWYITEWHRANGKWLIVYDASLNY